MIQPERRVFLNSLKVTVFVHRDEALVLRGRGSGEIGSEVAEDLVGLGGGETQVDAQRRE